jgi:hypothetical protein
VNEVDGVDGVSEEGQGATIHGQKYERGDLAGFLLFCAPRNDTAHTTRGSREGMNKNKCLYKNYLHTTIEAVRLTDSNRGAWNQAGRIRDEADDLPLCLPPKGHNAVRHKAPRLNDLPAGSIHRQDCPELIGERPVVRSWSLMEGPN